MKARATKHAVPNFKTPMEVGRTPARSCRAFTLIELLVVIAVMAILASLVLPVTWAVNRAKILSRSRAEMQELITRIDSYKVKYGHYPPDNPNNYAINQLYYELAGTKLDNSGVYQTMDGNSSISANALKVQIGPQVSGLVNSSRGASGDEGVGGKNFLKGIKSTEIKELPTGAKVLVGLDWQAAPPAPFNTSVITKPGFQNLNPWRYNSSAPTNNPNSYDLWLPVRVGNKVRLVCNWNPQAPEIKTWY